MKIIELDKTCHLVEGVKIVPMEWTEEICPHCHGARCFNCGFLGAIGRTPQGDEIKLKEI